MDDGKDWTWYAALAQGSADLIQGLGPGPYTRLLYNIQYWRSHPRGLGSDGQMRNRRGRNWESDKKRLTPVKEALPSAILYL